MYINFGGFVPISTVDWRGRAACTVFLRGCPARCFYCHNVDLQGGEDLRDADEIIAMIRSSRTVAGAVVFSGGEPTLQGPALLHLAAAARTMGLSVGLHTNGIFPGVLEDLLDRHLVDMVALDIKTTWERYDDLLGLAAADAVKRSLAACRRAKTDGSLVSCQIVVTLFRGREDNLPSIAEAAGDLDLVLQQGVAAGFVPLTRQELEAAAAPLRRSVLIRTREDGEVGYDPEQKPFS
ncbi:MULTISPECIES: anaerobic ribonucleoside-triphosphate reductase activating protein [unclassified Methanoculleus]|uniref:anaerobic ribonucleoside-triphosphate reductase activating protein n=1 Tax=unclassified Methanoculleus TaxID=2619537 RepID=UPI0025EF0CE0|nr:MULTISPECIES: anaerobic ribonucleoside-triphosphate reductase activating protein [unclassified Methanoculleus]MCK9317338.1 anaerobic ribonucleoside-triphosphate reductase activating protein [Methanoculleus sp.]MDD2253040.1 anaerobic ribonucleoside-triphosphate reductase activating protein [Methanoculleus sp.]MDD2786636.1 anaerobic ribonucleoside-triphosphate reductase activating protein [Methanoculleus sp.]MDD3216229.1 anaerobic ribonucleoside-triphosphate reductase activating protein [Metha